MKKILGIFLVVALVATGFIFNSGRSSSLEAEIYPVKRVYATVDLAATLMDCVGIMRLAPTDAARFYGYSLLASDVGLNQGKGEHQQQVSAVAGALTALGLVQAPKVKREMRAFLERQLVVVGDEYYNQGKAISERVLAIANYDAYDNMQDRVTAGINPKVALPVEYTWSPTGTGDGPLDPKFVKVTPLFKASAECILPEPKAEDIKREATELYKNFKPEDAVGKDVLWWLAGTGTATPTGYWLRMANFYIADNQLDAFKASKLLAMIAVTDFDAAIEIWNNKYGYNVARPETMWKVLYGAGVDKLPRDTPNHPSYPSGHSGFSQAAADIIVNQLGQVPLRDILPPDLYASSWKMAWNTPQDAVNEASMSRIHSGFHYPMDTKAGQDLGSCVAKAAINGYDSLVKGLIK